jgi:hypothetical protein
MVSTSAAPITSDVWLEELRSIETIRGVFQRETGITKVQIAHILLGLSVAASLDIAQRWEAQSQVDAAREGFGWDADAQRRTLQVGSRRYSFEDAEFPEVARLLASPQDSLSDEVVKSIEARVDEAVIILQALTANVPK